MSDTAVTFEITDELQRRAVRAELTSLLAEHCKLRDLLWLAASFGVFVLALVRESHWLWWLAGVPAAGFATLLAGWTVCYFACPRLAVKRVAHLPHRRVAIEMSPAGIAFATATERLEVAWSEIKTLRKCASFWIVGLRSGARLPLPTAALTDQAREILSARTPRTAT